MNRTRRTHRTAVRLTLLAVLATVIAAVGIGSAPSASAVENGWIRAGHLAPGTVKADVRLTPFQGGDPVTIRGVGFGDITDYARVPAGLYTLAVVPAGSDMSVTPMISRTVRVDAGTARTVIATGDTGDVRAEVISDDLTPPPSGQAKVRLVSAADSGNVDARVVDGPILAEEVVTGGSTGYANVEAQTWSIEVSTGDRSSTSRVPVESGSVYTLLVTDAENGDLRLSAVRDSAGAEETPVGGMRTGHGPAVHGEGAAGGPPPAVLGAAGLLALVMVLLPACRTGRTGARR